VPTSAATLLDQLGVNDRSHAALDDRDGWYAALQDQRFRIAPPTPIFPRREVIEEEPA
jgi:methionyl-tRNA synthetase